MTVEPGPSPRNVPSKSLLLDHRHLGAPEYVGCVRTMCAPVTLTTVVPAGDPTLGVKASSVTFR